MKRLLSCALLAGVASATLAGAALGQVVNSADRPSTPVAFPSTNVPLPSHMTALTNATILTGTGQEIREGVVLLANGRIVAVGRDISIPAEAEVIDARGR